MHPMYSIITVSTLQPQLLESVLILEVPRPGDNSLDPICVLHCTILGQCLKFGLNLRSMTPFSQLN